MTDLRTALGAFIVFIAAMLGFAGLAAGSLGLVITAALLFFLGMWVGDLQNRFG